MSVTKIWSDNFAQEVAQCLAMRSTTRMPLGLCDEIDTETDVYIGVIPIHIQHLVLLSTNYAMKYKSEYARHEVLFDRLMDTNEGKLELIAELMRVVEKAVLPDQGKQHSDDGMEELFLPDEARVVLHTMSTVSNHDCIGVFLSSVDALEKHYVVETIIKKSIYDMFPRSRLHIDLKYAEGWHLYGAHCTVTHTVQGVGLEPKKTRDGVVVHLPRK